MDISTFGQFIGSYGFPIAACIALFWYMNRERENHKQEIDSLKDTINENTVILASLKTLIETLERRLSDA